MSQSLVPNNRFLADFVVLLFVASLEEMLFDKIPSIRSDSIRFVLCSDKIDCLLVLFYIFLSVNRTNNSEMNSVFALFLLSSWTISSRKRKLRFNSIRLDPSSAKVVSSRINAVEKYFE